MIDCFATAEDLLSSTGKFAHLIANSRSGKGKGVTLADEAQILCDELGYMLIRYEIKDAKDFELQSRKAVAAAEKDGGVVIAAGGDGTIRGVAQEAFGRPIRFAAIPCGTFNFFARTHRIPEDPIEALRLALTAETRPVRLGQVNGHIFLINASLGMYAKSIREREKSTSRFGRNRLVVILSTLFSLVSSYLLLRVDLIIDKKLKTVKTPMIFIGNNALQLRNLSMDVAKCMKSDLLAVVMMKPVTKLETIRVLIRGIFKTLEDDEKLDSFCVEELVIHAHRKTEMVALDGEILRMTYPLRIQALPKILNLVLPPPEDKT